jgi:NitT/TauT family transport system substrate-binding protein
MKSYFESCPCRMLSSAVVVAAALLSTSAAGAAQEAKAVFAVPGIPPVFGGVIAFVAEKEGFFKKYGVDATVRPFDSGAAAARAVAAGDVEIALSPTPLIVNQVSNSDVKLVAVYGLENPDWLLGSTDPALGSCKDVRGKPVGVESVGGARALALKEMIRPCGLKLEDVQQVALGTSVDQAMVAGQLTFGVLHLDDIPGIEEKTKKPLKIITTLKQSTPVSHYLVAVVNQDKLAKDRKTIVGLVAGLLEADKFMRDPANAKKVAQLAAPTGRSAVEAEKSLETYLAMEFWPKGHAGLTRKNLESIVAKQQAIGGIRPDKKPVAIDKFADTSVFEEALALTKSR